MNVDCITGNKTRHVKAGEPIPLLLRQTDGYFRLIHF